MKTLKEQAKELSILHNLDEKEMYEILLEARQESIDYAVDASNKTNEEEDVLRKHVESLHVPV